jgi:Uma2 family endonuclease
MGSVADRLVTWADFQEWPERDETGQRVELHDGEIILVPPARPIHIKLQKRLERLLESLCGDRGVVTTEFPYRPVPNLQYWFADVAYVLQADWDALPPHDYPVYSPALIIEVLSPSNTPGKVNRQRIVALSAGTQEFWVVDAEKREVHVTTAKGTRSYASSETIPITAMAGATLAVDAIFAAV